MAEQPIPISGIADPEVIRVQLLASGRPVHAPLVAIGAAFNVIYNWATVTHAAPSKTTPVDADELSIVDSAASNVIKKLTWANLKAALKTYFDTLYQPLAATLTSWAAVTRASGFDTFVATPSSANLRSVLTDETGTGAAVFAGAPTITGIPIFSGIPSLTGGGLTFPATQVPSAGANDLDDYEEGSWTPALTFNNAAVSMTFSLQVGQYTKIGRLVFVLGVFSLSAKGSSTGQARITGLPFTASANSGAINVMFFSSMASLVDGFFGVVGGTSGTTIDLRTGGAANPVAMTEAHFTNTSNIYFTSVFYV